jgi:large subunit ribosomal protein L22
MKVGYAYNTENEGFVAKACGREMRIKSKDCREICAAIQGMDAIKAKAFLQSVLDGKAYIPYKKTKSQGGHKSGMQPYGKRPVKAVDAVLGVLNSAISNAEFKGLDTENLKVVSALSQRGHKVRRQRPQGRQALYNIHLTTVQIVVEEISE